MKNTIYPCIWFNNNAQEAAALYCSIFGNSTITSSSPLVTKFELNGQPFMGLNGGPMFSPNPSISLYVDCETMEEIETAWNRLSEGGMTLMALNKYAWSEKYGWLQDKFGVNWQLSYKSIGETGQKFTPNLLFCGTQVGKTEEAILFYTSIFENASVRFMARYEKGDNDVEGYIKHTQFLLREQVFTAMDSSLMHQFAFSEGFSLVVECENQAEIDHFWTKLTADGGQESQCGWLKDKYGVSWQIIPTILETLMNNPEKAPNVMQAFLKMKKFDIETLLKA